MSALTASDRGLWAVYVINGENIIERRLVEVIHNEASRAYVRGLLSDRDRVVNSGVQRIVPGQTVLALRAEENSVERPDKSVNHPVIESTNEQANAGR